MTSCVGVAQKDWQRGKGEESTAFGLIKVRTTGSYSRGYQTQLRFFHLLNLGTGERFRVGVQSAAKVFILDLAPGDYEVIRVQFNEGPMMMESHISLQFQVRPNKTTYLGIWQFDVDSPRTQRMLRAEIFDKQPNWEEIPMMHRVPNQNSMEVFLPKLESEEIRLFTVAPYPKISYYYR
ncbi:MAG: hypothetical protein OEZ57_09410 [Nitrospirota bacterium]|nr:hypothetical protein [Nitrospirota bacterium]MDH5775115.1 hypothetical protein [Nitrospirota bacterium]